MELSTSRATIASFICSLLCTTVLSAKLKSTYSLSIIHINDFHARFEATNIVGGTCGSGETCVGGYARTVSTVKRLLEQNKNRNVLYLNAGDSFQGTLWYNIGRWRVTSDFLNMLPADAMTLGNHEFDHGIDGLVPFLKSLKSPMLAANIDTSKEPKLNGLYQKSLIITRGDRKIGIIGVVLRSFNTLSKTENVIFSDESEAVISEAIKLKASGANIIIVLSHCGYLEDQRIAKEAGAHIDVIVGSHSHTFLYSGKNLPGPEKPEGNYPTEIIHESGNRVLIVQAASYARYVGYIELEFDNDGGLVKFDGAPIYMHNKQPEDMEVLEALKPWQEIVNKQGSKVIAETAVDLLKDPCGRGECNLGNFVTDAFLYHFATHKSVWRRDKKVQIALIQNGAMRVSLLRGNITYAQMVTMMPYKHEIYAIDLKGEKLLEVLEYSASKIDVPNTNLQVAGLQIKYNYSKPVGERVVDLKVRCDTCLEHEYTPFQKQQIYRVALTDFMINGGDGFDMIRDFAANKEYGQTDIDIFTEYAESISPITTGLEGRITVVDR